MRKKLLFTITYLLGVVAYGQNNPPPYSLVIDADPDVITMPTSTSIDDKTSDTRTVEFWFKPADVTSTSKQMIFTEGDDTRGINAWFESGRIYMGMFNADDAGSGNWYGTWFRTDPGEQTIVQDEWYHVAMVLDNTGTIKWYFDAELIHTSLANAYRVLHPHASGITVNSTVSTLIPNTATWDGDGMHNAVDATTATGLIGSNYLGEIALLRVWDSARSLLEIKLSRYTIKTSVDTDDLVVAVLKDGSFQGSIKYVSTGGTVIDTPGGSTTGTIYIYEKTWLGTVDSDWTNSANWEFAATPVPGDTPRIDTDGAGSHPIITTDITDIYAKISIIQGSELTINSSGKLETSNDFRNVGTLTVESGGELKAANSMLNASSGSTLGEVHNRGTITVVNSSGDFGSFSNNGHVHPENGIFNCDFRHVKEVEFPTTSPGMVFNGFFQQGSSDNITIGNSNFVTLNGDLIINSGKVLTINKAIAIGGKLDNSGTLTQTEIVTVAAEGVSNSGSAIYNLGADIIITGYFNNNTGATLNLNGNITLDAVTENFTNKGIVNIASAGKTITAEFFNNTPGEINFTNVITFDGPFKHASNTELDISSAIVVKGKLTNTKVININNDITFDPVTVANKLSSTGTLNIANGVTIDGFILNSSRGEINFLGDCTITRSLTNSNDYDYTTDDPDLIQSYYELTFPSGTFSIRNIINNKANAVILIKPGAKLDIAHSGGKSITNRGTITIESTGVGAAGTGSLKTEGTVTILGTGTYNVERWIDATATKWQLISSPVTAEESRIFKGHFLNYYDELPGDFVAISPLDHPLEVGEGFVVKFDGNQAGIPGMPNPITFSDTYTSEDQTRDLLAGVGNTYFGLPAGFNLVGNPFPSNLDWDVVAIANPLIDATMYFYVDTGNGIPPDPDNPPNNGTTLSNGWQTYNTSDVDKTNQNISIGQGFGVVITGNSGDMTMNIPNDARTHHASNGFNKKQDSKSNYFKLNAVSNNVIDKIEFQVNSNATENFDSRYDAYKLNSFGYSPTPSFISADNKKLAVCQTTEVDLIDMGFVMESNGEVVFSLSDVSDFTEIVLEDKAEGTFTNLMDEDYTFQYSDEDDEYGRFTLYFNRGSLGDKDLTQNLKIYSYNSDVYISSPETLEDVNVEVFNTNGQLVFSNNYSSLKEKQITTELSSGIYILKVASSTGVTTQRISLLTSNF